MWAQMEDENNTVYPQDKIVMGAKKEKKRHANFLEQVSYITS